VPIEERILGNFTGGEVFVVSSMEARENQWLLIEGLVLDENRRLRSQWPGVTWQSSVAEEELSS